MDFSFNSKGFKSSKTEQLKTINLLLSNIGINYLWKQLSKLFQSSCKKETESSSVDDDMPVQHVGCETVTVLEVCAIVGFILENMSLESYPETASGQMPAFLKMVIYCLTKNCSRMSYDDVNAAIKVCSKIISKIQAPTEPNTSGEGNDALKEEENPKGDPEGEEEDIASWLAGCSLNEILRNFFCVFVQSKLVKNSSSLQSYFNLLRVSSYSSEREQLFESHAELEINDQAINVYVLLCNLLVEASSVPVLGAIKDEGRNSIISCTELAEWLREILTLSAFVNNSRVSYPSISAILDMAVITKALLFDLQIPNSLNNGTGSPVLDFKENTKNVTLEPIITASELAYIYHQTDWFMLITNKLWQNLSDEYCNMHLETVSLLQQLHNLSNDASVCESVICSSMLSPDEAVAYASRKKFAILYNVTRDIKLKSVPVEMMKEFDRPLFFMLDSLSHKYDVHNAQAIDWLNQSLKNGDIARILEPLLFILLHPDTNRVSVQHVNIHQPDVEAALRNDDVDNVSIATSESKIFAISSTGGNVIYHINHEGKKRFLSAVPHHKVLTLTSQCSHSNLKSANKWVTSKLSMPEYEVPPNYESVDKLSINMFFNPFGSMSSLNSDANETYDNSSLAQSLPNLSNIKRFDIKTGDSGKTNTSCSTTPLPSHLTPDPTTTSTPVNTSKKIEDTDADFEIIRLLLDELIEEIDRENSGDSEDSTTSSSKHTAITNSESISLNSARPVTVNQLYSHFLLYGGVYDSRRTLYALSSLINIINTEPQKVLFSMATTSISNRLSARSQELQVVCARHRSSLFGKGFYNELSSDAVTSFRSSSFLEVVVTTCLYYVRSYYPSLPQSRLTEEELRGNQKVRILSCDILKLIFSQLVITVKARPNLTTYFQDMLMKCKVQKTILQCVLASVSSLQTRKEGGNDDTAFAEAIIDFNEKNNEGISSGFQEDYQKSLLKLLEELVILEHKVAPSSQTGDKDLPTHNR